MAISSRPKRPLTNVAKPNPMDFIQEAETRSEALLSSDTPSSQRRRKEPVIIRFDEETLTRLDQAAAKRRLFRAALVRFLVMENLPD